jgi:hypothetical protein
MDSAKAGWEVDRAETPSTILWADNFGYQAKWP